MRIFDRLASGESVLAGVKFEAPSNVQASWRKLAHTATRLVADEASQYQSQSDQVWHVADGDFGVMRPAFDVMWIEWQTPRTILVDGKWYPRSQQQIASVVQQRDAETLMVTSLTSWRGAPIVILPFYAEISHFDDLLRIDCLGEFVHSEEELLLHHNSRDEALAGLNGQLIPLYLTLGWLNCRNVSTQDHATPRAVKAKRQRRGTFLGLDYKRIVLDEKTKSALTRNQAAERTHQRLHIVRGHIKHYTAERPLFGKLTGNYWWHQQMRGDATLGRINHEYHVTSRGPR